MPPKLFSFTHFPKNASATPLVSHTFKTKDLKPFRFTHLQKSGGVSLRPATVVIPSEPPILAGDEGSQRSQSPEPQPANHRSPVYPEAGRATNHQSLCLSPLTSTLTNFPSASPLDSALTLKRPAKSFTSNTYEKHTGGGGVCGVRRLDAALPGTTMGAGSHFPTSNLKLPTSAVGC